MKLVSDEVLDLYNDLSLEASFMVLEPDDPETGGKWGVMDAECQLVATCPSEKHARIVAVALDYFAPVFWEAWGERHKNDG